MDLLTHLFLPLTVIYGARMNNIKDRHLLLLSFFALLPDFDVFLGVHRGLFHSLFFVLPIGLLSFFVAESYSRYIALFLFSHLTLDFITGGVPFLYPLIESGIGVEFPLVLKFGSVPVPVEYLPKLVPYTPIPVHGESFEAFSSFGIASTVAFLSVFMRKNASPGGSETKTANPGL